jgi:hypothetical protein
MRLSVTAIRIIRIFIIGMSIKLAEEAVVSRKFTTAAEGRGALAVAGFSPPQAALTPPKAAQSNTDKLTAPLAGTGPPPAARSLHFIYKQRLIVFVPTFASE